MANVASDASLNLKSDSNRNPEVKSSVPCTSIPVDTKDEFHTSQARFSMEEITNAPVVHQLYPMLTTTSTGCYSFGLSITRVLWFRG